MTLQNLARHTTWLERTRPGLPLSIAALNSLLEPGPASLAAPFMIGEDKCHPQTDREELPQSMLVTSTFDDALGSPRRSTEHQLTDSSDGARRRVMAQGPIAHGDREFEGRNQATGNAEPYRTQYEETSVEACSQKTNLPSAERPIPQRRSATSTDSHEHRKRRKVDRSSSPDTALSSLLVLSGVVEKPLGPQYFPSMQRRGCADIESVDLTEHSPHAKTRKWSSIEITTPGHQDASPFRKNAGDVPQARNLPGSRKKRVISTACSAPPSSPTLPRYPALKETAGSSTKMQHDDGQLRWSTRMSPSSIGDFEGNHGSGDESIAAQHPIGQVGTQIRAEKAAMNSSQKYGDYFGNTSSLGRVMLPNRGQHTQHAPPAGVVVVSDHRASDGPDRLDLLRRQYSELKHELLGLLNADKDIPDELIQYRRRLQEGIYRSQQVTILRQCIQDSRLRHQALGERILGLLDDGKDHGQLRQERKEVEQLIETQLQQLSKLADQDPTSIQASTGIGGVKGSLGRTQHEARTVEALEPGNQYRTHMDSPVPPDGRDQIIRQTPNEYYELGRTSGSNAVIPAAKPNISSRTQSRPEVPEEDLMQYDLHDVGASSRGVAQKESPQRRPSRLHHRTGQSYNVTGSVDDSTPIDSDLDDFAIDENDFGFPNDYAPSTTRDPLFDNRQERPRGTVAPPIPIRSSGLVAEQPISIRNPLSEISGNAGTPLSLKGPNLATSPDVRFLMRYKWSPDVENSLIRRFHLRGFRHNQLEAINATLSGKDTFVLMPTGGGKSLCYQLPSILSSGQTRGVSIVVSPLLSLMHDQVEHLHKLNIQAFLYNGDMSNEARQVVLKGLNAENVEKLVQLLYVTPEMLTKSKPLVNTFERLYQRKKLARIVIDEAHCVSQWGHDFRPDYKMLGAIRTKFAGIPVMALTATATKLVQADVIHNLNIQGCETFSQSFNRFNLTYEIRPKTKEVIQEIAALITTLHDKQTGIIYALSRKSCESIAEKLRKEYRVRAHHYHAGMASDERAKVQEDWQNGKHHVIVATIAFGMGIDKADVRYVIHHTIPKSLEGYYQETGRAGRDSKPSACYLFYGYKDSTMLKKMIEDGEGSAEQKDRQRKMLRDVIQFCENRSDCRRVQVLAYFDELFRKEDCHATCDNCTSSVVFEDRDFTDLAVKALELVQQLQEVKVTLVHCIDVFRGVRTRKIINEGHDRCAEHGAGQELDRGDVERLFYRLSAEDAISEYNVVNKAGFANSYVQLGRNAPDFLHGRRRLKIQCSSVPSEKSRQTTATRAKRPLKANGQSTNRRQLDVNPYALSSEEDFFDVAAGRATTDQSTSKLTALGYHSDDFVVNDDLELIEDHAGHRTGQLMGSMNELGRPISQDNSISHLQDFHQELCLGFVEEATRICRRLRGNETRSRPLFSEVIFRQMAINFPSSLSEMRSIPNINFADVERYGGHLLPLIRNTQAAYEDNMGNEERSRRITRPTDQHAANVIDLCEDNGDSPENDFEIDERSHHFDADPAAEAFNTQVAQASAMSRGEPPERGARLDSSSSRPSQPIRRGPRKTASFHSKPRANGNRRDGTRLKGKRKPTSDLVRAMPT